jgi:acetyl esterase/lipase
MWLPEGKWSWVLTAASWLALVTMALVAYAMIEPVAWWVVGPLGAFALHYPLHILAVTVVMLGLWFIARRVDALMSVWVSALTALVTAAMALVPAIAVLQASFHYDAPLSLGSYIVNAGRMNAGLPRPDRTVSYGTTADGTELMLDVWLSGRPRTGPLRPAVVMVHGGGWVEGNRSMLPEWNRWLNELGYEVFDLEYRLPPPARWLDEVADVKSALGWLAECAAEFHVDPARISLMGWSSGGNIAMLAAYTMADPRLPPSTGVAPVAVRCVIDMYGPSELSSLYRESPDRDHIQARLDAYIGGPPEEFQERYALVSPLSHIGKNSPPTIVILGSSDRLVNTDQGQMAAQTLAAAGIAQDLVIIPAADHGFDVNWGGFATQIARYRIEQFLAKHTAS